MFPAMLSNGLEDPRVLMTALWSGYIEQRGLNIMVINVLFLTNKQNIESKLLKASR